MDKEREEKPHRELYTAYICATCDTDFGINDAGTRLEDGIHSLECPMCHENTVYVYYIVKSSLSTCDGGMCRKYNEEEEQRAWKEWRELHHLGWKS